MKKGTVYLDVDGVLLDYTRPFLQYTQERFHPHGVTYETLDTYDLSTLFPSENKDQAKLACAAAMLEFHNSEAFENLPSILHPLFLSAVQNAGLEMKIITKLPNSNPSMRLSRLGNLTKFFGGVFSEIIVTSNECKLELINSRKATGEKVWLVEDNPVLLLKAEGEADSRDPLFKVLAVEHPYNAKDFANLNRIPVFKTPAQAIQSILLEVV